MNKKRITIVLAALLMSAVSLVAQQAEPVHAVIVSGKDSTWYASQAEAWEAEVKKYPKSEEAWRNLFYAKYYLKYWYNGAQEQVTPGTSVLERMEQAIPESFTYNLCRYKISMASNSEFAERALTMIPDNVDLEAVADLLGYLWRMAADLEKGERGAQFNEMLKWQYEGGYYPDFALRYNYNQLEGMPENAIYVGHGDLDLFPKIMMQKAMNLHADKFFVVSSFLFIKDYRDSICAHLGIAPYESEEEQFELPKFIHYLSEQTSRPIYLNVSVPYNLDSLSNEGIKEFCNCLYQEGLLLKYSPTPYDNAEAALRAFEKYHLEYLTEPRFRTETYWKGSEKLQVNYATLLSNFIQRFKSAGDVARAQKLYHILRASITNTQLDEPTKLRYLQHLENFRP
ncbi:MAG: sugar ABC transporter substrate-binding protein [Bacteroidaceae bacterium]|nr:sugar ABC transporter substrate-binding protein [Bacteroidaceae bacterium]